MRSSTQCLSCPGHPQWNPVDLFKSGMSNTTAQWRLAKRNAQMLSPQMTKNVNIEVEPTLPAVSAKHVSIGAKSAISGTNAVPDAKILTMSTWASTRKLRKELKEPPRDGMFKLSGGWQKCFSTTSGLSNSIRCRLWHRRKCFLFDTRSICSSSSKDTVVRETMS